MPQEVREIMQSEKLLPGTLQWIGICFICILLIAGCDAALTVGGRTMGIRSGNFIFTDGSLAASYNFPFDKTRQSCEQTLIDMKASGIEKTMKISTGTIDAIIQDEKVRMYLEYVSPEKTLVSVRVGITGNSLASQLIHEKIASNLSKATNGENQKAP